jgi:hypothetical protein
MLLRKQKLLLLDVSGETQKRIIETELTSDILLK